MRIGFVALTFVVGCGSSPGGTAGSGGADFRVCCNESGGPTDGLRCCEDPGPDVNVNDGEALVIDGQINNISVNRGVVLFTEDACVCGFFNINSSGARAYVDRWDDGVPLRVTRDANVNANAYLYVRGGGLWVENNFANNSGGATLLEGNLEVAANLYLNSGALMCTMEGAFMANPVVDNGGTLSVVGVPDIEEDLGETFTGDLDDVSRTLSARFDDELPNESDGTTYRVLFLYDADTLDEPIRLPMLFESRTGRWSEVGR